MTGDQLTFDELADRGAEELEDPCDPSWHDLSRQEITAWQYHRMAEVSIAGEWL